MKGKEITDLGEALKLVNYPMWFSDAMAKGYVSTFEKRYSEAKIKEDKERIFVESLTALSNYLLLVYYIYPNNKDFKKTIDKNPELKGNYEMIRAWFDSIGAKRYADELAKTIAAGKGGRG